MIPIQKGHTFGHMHVTKKLSAGGNGSHATFACKCECGNVVSLRSSVIRASTDTRTCGSCLVHLTGSKADARALYMVWYSMIQRCYAPKDKNPNYARYRARGIRVCKAWYRSQLRFVQWALANGWTRDLQLDRIDNDSGYRPSNCRFVTHLANSRNREATPMVVYRSKRPRPLSELVTLYGKASHGTVFNRYLRLGWDIEKALLTPAWGNTSGMHRH